MTPSLNSDEDKATKEEKAIADLKQKYVQLGNPISHSGPLKVFKHYEGIIPYNKVVDTLSSIENYTLFRENRKRRRKYNPIMVHAPCHTLEGDLVELYKDLKEHNAQTRYLFCIIDVFTRAAYVRPIRTKDADTICKAFKSMLHEIKKRGVVKNFVCDLGNY